MKFNEIGFVEVDVPDRVPYTLMRVLDDDGEVVDSGCIGYDDSQGEFEPSGADQNDLVIPSIN